MKIIKIKLMSGLKVNKKGSIPITILVIGVFVVCTLALFSFFAANISLRNMYAGIDKIEEANVYLEKSELHKLPLEVYKSHYSLDYVKRGFKDELLFRVEYENP